MEKEVKNKYIHIRINNEFKDKVAGVANDKGLSLSTLVNVLLKQWYNENK